MDWYEIHDKFHVNRPKNKTARSISHIFTIFWAPKIDSLLNYWSEWGSWGMVMKMNGLWNKVTRFARNNYYGLRNAQLSGSLLR